MYYYTILKAKFKRDGFKLAKQNFLIDQLQLATWGIPNVKNINIAYKMAH